MYDRKKIIINHLRAYKSRNKKVILFLNRLFEEALERLEINNKSVKYNILEIYARNKILETVLKQKQLNYLIYKTVSSSKLNLNKHKPIVHDRKLSSLKKKNFDFCISIFPPTLHSDLLNTLECTHRMLSDGGRFLFLFHSLDSCINLKSLFYNFSDFKTENSFLPCFDILSLGNYANSIGYKNVVVDKSKYFIINDNVNEIWKFIRDLGESNYLLNRNKKNISRSNYNSLSESIKTLFGKNGKIINEISITFLIGTKKS